MLLLASNASRSGQGELEGVPSISSMDAERFGMASRPLQRYAFAGERVQLALQRLLQRYRPQADIGRHYSMTSSAIASSLSGICSSSAFGCLTIDDELEFRRLLNW